MGRLRTNSDDRRGVVGDVFIVEGETDGTHECGVAMVRFVLGGFCEDSRERVDAPQLFIGDDHEERKNALSDGKEIVIRWFPFEGGKGIVGLFEEAGNGVRRHGWKKKKIRRSSLLDSRAGAVEDRNDDDQSDSVGEGKLRVLGAFGDSSESVGSRDCDCSSGCLVGIKFELDFHCRERYAGP